LEYFGHLSAVFLSELVKCVNAWSSSISSSCLEMVRRNNGAMGPGASPSSHFSNVQAWHIGSCYVISSLDNVGLGPPAVVELMLKASRSSCVRVVNEEFETKNSS